MFEEMKGSLSCLPKDNQWVKIGNSLPWDEFDKLYLSKLRNNGRGAKISMTKENRQDQNELGIQCMGERHGRPPKVKSREQIDNERIGSSLRNEVEAAFGTSKRVYRANNIRAKLLTTAECWTDMCYFVNNLTKFLRLLCRVLTEKLTSMRILGIIRLAIGELARKILHQCCSEAKTLIA